MTPAERQAWIVAHLEKEIEGHRVNHNVNVLDRYFVDDYIAVTGAAFGCMPYGANICPQLGRDLSALYKAGRLCRYVSGLTGMGGMGFPRWVYVYQLPKEKPARGGLDDQ